METFASPEARDACRERQRHAQANEDAAWQPDGWHYLEWRDVFTLRHIAALHGVVFPGPQDDALTSA